MPRVRFSHVLVLALFSLTSCEKIVPLPTVNNRPQAVAKLQKITQEEFKVPVVVRDLDHTVWIYVPLEDRILDLVSKPDVMPDPGDQPQQKLGLQFIKVSFKDNAFHIEYDIAQVKVYPGGDPGYQTVYPEYFRLLQQNITGAVARSYLDLEEVPGDIEFTDAQKQTTHKRLVDAYVKTDKAPLLFVFIYADIIRGIKMVNITHFRDLKAAMNAVSPMSLDEYTNRFLSEVKGDSTLIGDKAGANVPYREILMPEFLASQIEHRVRIKYQMSSFPPGEDAVREILPIVAAATQAYGFTGYQMVHLHDRATGKTLAFEPAQLKTFQE